MITLLIVGAVALLLVSAALSPLESLSWWAGWGQPQPVQHRPGEAGNGDIQAGATPEADHYLIYLSGIGAISGTDFPEEEYPFLAGLAERLPDTRIVADVYPYSVTNNGLTGQRTFARIWRWINRTRLSNPASMLPFIVNLRNAFQLFVSADRRYGPVYNLGVAQEIWRGLLRHGYQPGSGKPITLIGWSGGGQIAIGAVTYLAAIGAPVRVISLGGMLSDDIGLKRVEHLWHLYGEKDKLQALGKILYAGRWPALPQSPWNRALADGRITLIALGPYNHNGKGNYFDMKNSLPTGEIYGQRTLDMIVAVLGSAGLVPAQDVAQDVA